MKKLLSFSLLSSLALVACNSGTSSNATNMSTTSIVANNTDVLQSFKKKATAEDTRIVFFSNETSDSELNFIDKNNLNNISDMTVVDAHHITSYFLPGNLYLRLDCSSVPTCWMGMYNFTEQDIKEIDTYISPTMALQDLFSKCSNEYSESEVELVHYSLGNPTILKRQPVYDFTLYAKDYDICFQATYGVKDHQSECIAKIPVTCNIPPFNEIFSTPK